MKKILTSNGKILTENGKILTANVESGGGGIVEVEELPEVGKANTVYKLVNKIGTAIPTTGLIENVYLNTSLSIDEVNAILKTIEYIPATNEGEPDIYIVFETLDSIVRIFDYNNGSYAIMVGMNVAYVSDESFASAGATFVGWSPELTNPYVVNQESTPTDDFVSQNDKLTSLFSVTPFEEKIPSEMYYLYHKSTPVAVPNSGIVENVYFNTKLSVDEVTSLLEQLTYIEADGENYFILSNTDGTYLLSVLKNNNEYAIFLTDENENITTYFINMSGTLSETLGVTFTGWNPNVANNILYNNTASSSIGDYTVGAENDKLTSLFSTTPFPYYEQISGGILEVDKLPTSGEENYVYKIQGIPTAIPYMNVEGVGVVNLIEFGPQQGTYVEIVDIVDSVDNLPTSNIKETVEKEIYGYYVRNDNYYVYGSFGDDGAKIWVTISALIGLPFVGEITNVSEITELNSVYALVSGGKDSYYIYDNKLKPFPNKGTISEIYFNTDLSVDEVVAELSKLTLDEDGIYVLGGSFETPCLLYITYHETAGWTIQDVFKSNIFFTSTYWDPINSAGWNYNLIKNGKYTFDEPIKLLTYNDDGDIVGAENWKITNVVRVFENKWTKISGGGATVKATPIAVPNTGFVERVYFNTKLTDAEIVATLDKLAELEGMTTVIWPMLLAYIDENNTVSISAMKSKFGDADEKFWIIELIESSGEFNTIWSERSWNDGKNIINSGWSIGVNYIDINHEVVPEVKSDFDNGNIGNFNSEITNLFSLNGVFQEEEIELTESYDGNPLVLSNKYVKKTVVPNEGYVERVYLNTALSIDEVKEILNNYIAKHTSNEDNGYDGRMILTNIDNLDNPSDPPEKFTVLLISQNSDTKALALLNGFLEVLWTETTEGWAVNYTGWKPDLSYVEVNHKVYNFCEGISNNVGAYNDELVDLFSLTPFEEKIYDSVEVDIKEMLEEKKLPLSVKVNVESESANVVSQGGVVVPNNTYVEKIYFNTNLSIEEVVSLLSQLTYNSNDMYCLLSATDGTLGNTILVVTMGVMYAIADIDTQQYFFCNVADAGLGFVGWNPDFNGVYDINKNAQTESGIGTVGAENDKLTSLVSIDGFESKVIKTLEGDYEAVDIVVNENKTVDVETYLDNKKMPMSVKVNVPKVSVLELQYTPLVFGTVSSKIHFNTNLTTEEVDAILNNENLDYYVDYEDANIANYLIQFGETAESYYKLMLITKNYNKITKKSTFSINYGTTGGNTSIYNSTDGWLNSNYIPAVTINAFDSFDNIESTANKNFKLLELLFSSSPYNYEETKVLEGDYKAVDLEFNELPSVWKGKEIPNDEYIENIYFNTKLSIEEVDNILSTLDYSLRPDLTYYIGMFPINENQMARLVVINGQNYGLTGYAIRYVDIDVDKFVYVSNQTIVDFISSNLGVSANVGWLSDFNGILEINKNAIPEFADNIPATNNDKLVDLMSIEAPLENTIDLEQYLDNKQMPMSVTVNVESQEPNLQEKEITENGEYVADEGYDGFSKVTVNVAGEDMLQARVDATNSCEYLFYQYKGDNVDFIKDLDTSNVTNMSSMFNGCSMLKTIPQLDTSNVTNMISMFRDCSALETIQQLDMIKVSNASSMFNSCSKLTNLTLLNIKAQIDLSQNEKLTLESLINTVKEFINAGNARILTMGTANLSKIASTYVKFTDSSVTSIPKNEKGDVVVCESTDTGAMLLKDYALLKNWTLA